MKLHSSVLLVCLSVCSYCYAGEIGVTYADHTYHLHAVFDVDASSEQVMKVLTDFDQISELNPAIIESETQDSPSGEGIRVKTVIKDCVLFFCKRITRVEDVSQNENKKLEAFIIPMLSDLRSGYAVWELMQNATGTTVHYEASMQPKFWIPPIVRSYVLTKKFKKRVKQSIELLQAKAQQ